MPKWEGQADSLSPSTRLIGAGPRGRHWPCLFKIGRVVPECGGFCCTRSCWVTRKVASTNSGFQGTIAVRSPSLNERVWSPRGLV